MRSAFPSQGAHQASLCAEMKYLILVTACIFICTVSSSVAQQPADLMNVASVERTFLYQLTERILLLQREFNLIIRQFERTVFGLSGNQDHGKKEETASISRSDSLNLSSSVANEVVTSIPRELLPGPAQHALSVVTGPIYSSISVFSRAINSYFDEIVKNLVSVSQTFATRSNQTG